MRATGHHTMAGLLFALWQLASSGREFDRLRPDTERDIGGDLGVGARSKGDTSKRVISQYFRPVILRWPWRRCDGPELAARMMDQGDGGALGWSQGPAPAQEIDLVIGVDPAAQMEGQMQIQQGDGRAGTDRRALFHIIAVLVFSSNWPLTGQSEF